jgi:hypothetical protein
MSSVFQAMPLYAWIIIACVIILGLVVLIKLTFFSKTEHQKLNDELDKYLDRVPSEEFIRTHIGGLKKRKNKNIKKRRKYKK